MLCAMLEGVAPLSVRSAEILFMDPLCKACENECLGDHGKHIADMFVAAREYFVEKGFCHLKLRDF
jgi:hypothetical protein